MKIQQGCQVGTNPLDCEIDYNWGLIENSWGRTCRLVEWNRKVPSKSFIRLRLCSADSCSGCNETALTLCGSVIKNELLKFEVDGIDYVGILQDLLLNYDGVLGCIKVSCPGCCNSQQFPFTDLGNMPTGAEIVFGPIGAPLLYPPQVPLPVASSR